MLPQPSRLPIDEFPKKPAQKAVFPLFTVKIAPNRGPFNRFGVIISSSAVKLSVKRHKIKRIISAEAMAARSGESDVLLIGSPKLNNATEAEIRYAVTEIIKSLK